MGQRSICPSSPAGAGSTLGCDLRVDDPAGNLLQLRNSSSSADSFYRLGLN